MTCGDFEPLLQLYVDGEFTADDTPDLEAHLASCPRCDQNVREARRERALLRAHLQSAAQVPAPSSVRASVLAGVRRERRRAAAAQVSRWGSVTLAVAAATAVAWNMRPSLDDQLADEAALRHARRLPLEISAPSAANLETWFDGKLNHPVRLPQLTNATVAGARLSHLSSHDAAYVTYDAAPTHGGPPHRVGLFVLEGRNEDRGENPRLQVVPFHGYNVATWHGDGLTYQLVSDLDETEIRHMVGGTTASPYFIQPASFGSH